MGLIILLLIIISIAFEPLNASSKLNTEWCFLKHLHSLGYTATSSFLKNTTIVSGIILQWTFQGHCADARPNESFL